MKTSLAPTPGNIVCSIRPRLILTMMSLSFGIAMPALAQNAFVGGGDGVSWQDPNNWSLGTVPVNADQVVFVPPAGSALQPGVVQLNGPAVAGSLSLGDPAVIGAFGSSTLLGIVGSTGIGTPNISLNDPSMMWTINSRLTTTGATPGLVIGGSGGTLNLTNIYNSVDGPITVNGVTLLLNVNFSTPHVSGTGVALNSRSDFSQTTNVLKRSINLVNGGVLKIVGAGANQDGNGDNIIIGTNGGGINVGAGFQQITLDDHPTISVILDNQIQVAAGATNVSLTKWGSGRLTIGDSGTGPDFNLPLDGTVAGGTGLIINKGVVDFNTVENSTLQPLVVASRFSALSSFAATGGIVTQSTVTINNGGMLVLNSGTASKLDNNVILNAGGVLGGQAAAHYIGNYEAVAGVNVPTITLNGGTILARDAFTPQTQRFLRMRDILTGTGTVDLLAETANNSGGRIVFERGDLQAVNTFNGTFRLLENTTLESNPRNQSASTLALGKPIGNGTIELAGFNSGLDLREATTVATDLTAYQSNTLRLSTPGQGVNRLAVSGGTAPNFHFGNTTFTGSQYLQTTGAGSYYRTDNLNFAANSSPTIDTWSASMRVDNAVNAPTVDLTKLSGTLTAGNNDLHFANATTLKSLNIRSGSVILTGANGTLSTSAPIMINAGPAFVQGGLILDNTNTLFAGTAAASNATRLAASQAIEMRGGILQLKTLSGSTVNQMLNNLTAPAGYVNLDATKSAGTETATITLGGASGLGSTAVANFTGTNLGTAATGVGQIFLPAPVGVTAMPYIGAQFIVGGNTFASNGTNGVRAAVNGTDNTLVTTGVDTAFTTGTNIALTTAAVTMTINDKTVNSISQNVTALNTAGFKLNIESGGLLTHTTGTQISGTGAGGITAGPATGPATASKLFLTTNAATNLNAIVTDNLTGGALTVVKSGTGTLTLGNQTGVSQTTLGVQTGTPHTNTLTGGWIVNAGTLDVWQPSYLGTASATNNITLAGGTLSLNMLQNADHAQFNLGHDVKVEANSFLSWDNNASTGAGLRLNSQFNMGNLAVNGSHILSYGGFDQYDVRFNNGASFASGAMLESVLRDGNGHLIINGAITGTTPTFIADRAGGGSPNSTINQGWGSVTFGGGAADTTATALTGDLYMEGGGLRLDKANGTNAIGSGNITINGGSLFLGPGSNAQTYSGQVGGQYQSFNGFGLVAGYNDVSMSASGQNQIPETANITLLAGNLFENNRVTNETVGTVTMKNGQLNPGLGALQINTLNISGGNLALNSGSNLKVGTYNSLDGAPNINIPNGTTGAVTSFEVNNINLTGQAIIVNQSGAGANSAGGKMILSGTLSATTSDLNAGSYTYGIFIQTGSGFRTLSQNSVLDLAGGNRSFNINEQVQFSLSTKIVNGGIIKDGKGWLALEPFVKNTNAGDMTINQGVVFARGGGVLGGASMNTVNNTGTLRLEDVGTLTGENFALRGLGAEIPGSRDAGGNNPLFEEGALVNDRGYNTIIGTVAVSGGTSISSRALQAGGATAPSAGWLAPANNFGYLAIDSAAGITGSGGLTLTGFADGRVANGINTGTGGTLLKTGAGDWAINNSSSYDGVTEIAAGSLTIGHGGALGAVAGNTTVFGGASLRLMSNISTAEAITINGAGANDASGALVNLAGSNTMSADLTLGLASTVQSRAGLLTLTNVVGGKALTVNGSGNTTISGTTTTTSLTKGGTGTLILSGTGAMTSVSANGGVTAVTGGSAITDSAVVTLGGGTLRADLGTETIGGLVAGAGGGKVVTNGGNLALGAITHAGGGSVDFSGAGTIGGSGVVTGGVLPYSTFGGTSHATISGGNVVAFAGYTNADTAQAIASGDKEITVGANINSGSGITANTLRLGANSSGIALGAGTLSLATNTLIANNTGNAGLTGTGNINSSGDLHVAVSQASGSLDISAPLNIATGGHLVKSGAGTLFLSNTANVIPGNIYVNEGTLALNGPGGSAHPGQLGALNGTRTINLSGGTLSIPFGDYDPSPSGLNQMSIAIGAAGGTLNVGAGTLLLNDLGQFSATGDITKTGGGRLQIGQVNTTNIGAATPDNTPPATVPFPVRGNINVNEGILEMVGSGVGLGAVRENVITVANGAVLMGSANLGANVTRPINNDLVINNGGSLFSRNTDSRYDGQVTLNGTNTIGLIEMDLHNQNRSIYLANKVVQTGTTNIIGSSNGSALFLTGSANEITGTLNLGANVSLEARGQGSIGMVGSNATVNLNGANSRLLLRSDQNSDFYVNVNANHMTEIGADRPASGGMGANQLLAINNLALTIGRNTFTTSGGNTYAIRVNGTATVNSSSVFNSPRLNIASADLDLENGATFTNSDLIKHGGSSIISQGNLGLGGNRAILNNGGLYLRGAAGALSNVSNIELRGTGAVLTLDNGDGAPNANRLPDTTNIILGGGTLRVQGQENVLAASVTAASGQTLISFAPASVSAYSAGTVDPLTLNNFTRTKGAAVNFGNDLFGTPGTLSNGQIIHLANVNVNLGGSVQVSPRIIIPGQASVPQNASSMDANGLAYSVIPWAVIQNNEFTQYDSTTMDAGAIRGLYQWQNGNYTNNTQVAGVVNRWTGAQIITSVSIPAVKLDGAFSHTLAAGNTLTVSQGAMIFVSGTTTIAGNGNITTGAAGPNELFLTVNGTSVIESNILEGPSGTAVVRNGAAALNLNFFGNNNTNVSTYTGGFFQNGAGVTESRGPGKIPVANTITMAGGTLSFNPEFSNTGVAVAAPAANTVVAFGNDVRFVGQSLFRVDNGLNAGVAIAVGTGNFQLTFGKLTVESGILAQFSGFDGADIQFLNGAQFNGQAPIIDVADAGGGGEHVTRIAGNLNAPNGFFQQTSAIGNGAVLELGSGTGDTVANTIGGPVTMLSGTMRLNKANGTAALTSDTSLNGGTLIQLQGNQITDAVNLTINNGTYNVNGQTETIASVAQNGGFLTTGAGNLTVTGNYTQTGIGNGQADGLQINSGGTVNINGDLTVSGLGKVTVGNGANTRLNVGGHVTLNGSAINLNTGGSAIAGITGSVTVLPSANPSYLGPFQAAGDGTVKFDLLNQKTFDTQTTAGVSSAADSLVVSSVLQNGATPGGITKIGNGSMVLSGAAGANTYTLPTNVNAGTLVLNKTAGTNAIGAGDLNVNGTSRVTWRQSNQIPDAGKIVLASSGILDLEAANASEIVGSISSASASSSILLGSGSLLTTGDATTTLTYAGSIRGGGGITKQGSGRWELTGTNNDYVGATNVNAGNLAVNGTLHGTPVFVNSGGTLSGSGSISLERTGSLQADAAVLLAAGGTINPGNSPGTLSTGSLFTTGGTVNFELGGNTPGTYDALNVTGSLNLTGTTIANFSLFGGYVNTPTDIFYLLVNDGSDSILGGFSGLPEGTTVTIGGVPYMATYTADAGTNSTQGGNDFALIPEPTISLLCGLGASLALRRRRKTVG